MRDKGIESIIERAFTPSQLNRYISKYKNYIEYVRIGGRESIHSAREKMKKLNNSDYKKLIPDFLNENEWIEIQYNFKIKGKKRNVLLEYNNEKYKF